MKHAKRHNSCGSCVLKQYSWWKTMVVWQYATLTHRPTTHNNCFTNACDRSGTHQCKWIKHKLTLFSCAVLRNIVLYVSGKQNVDYVF